MCCLRETHHLPKTTADLLGPDGTSVELRVESANASDAGIGLCGSKRSNMKVIKLVRGSQGAAVADDDEDDVMQVRVDETQNCAGSMSLGLLCMPTEHILYVFSLRLQGHRWQVLCSHCQGCHVKKEWHGNCASKPQRTSPLHLTFSVHCVPHRFTSAIQISSRSMQDCAPNMETGSLMRSWPRAACQVHRNERGLRML